MINTDRFLKKYKKVSIILFAILFSTQMLNSTELNGVTINIIVSTVSLVALSVSEVIIAVKFLIEVKKARESGKTVWRALVPFATLGIMVIAALVRNSEADMESALIAIAMLCLLEGADYREILRTAFRCGTTIVFSMFILCMLGLVENNRGTSFGFIYRTDYACHLLFLLLIYCFYYSGKMSWTAMVGMLMLTGYAIVFVKGKTAALCMILVIVVTAAKNLPDKFYVSLSKFRTNRVLSSVNHAILRIFEFVFPICTVIVIVLSMVLSCDRSLAFSVISKTGTVGSRLHMSMVGIEQIPITVFGNNVVQQGYGGSTGYVPFYFFLDSSYVRLILLDGIVVFLLFIGVMLLLSIRMHRARMYYELFILAVVAADCTLEHHLIDISYNVFSVLAFSNMVCNEGKSIQSIMIPSKDAGADAKHVVKTTRSVRKIANCAVSVLIVAAFLCSCFTSYRIWNYSATTPEAEATVIIPGSVVDGIMSETLLNEKLKVAADYLKKHDDAVCLLCASDAENQYMSQLLLQMGINWGRINEISVLDKNVNDLVNAVSEYIVANQLPGRRAFCLFPVQQYVVGNVSHDLGFPFNSLTAKPPVRMYFPLYFVQQVKTVGFLLEKHEK